MNLDKDKITANGIKRRIFLLVIVLVVFITLTSNITVMHIMEDLPVLHTTSEKLLNKPLEGFNNRQQLILTKSSEIARKKGLNIDTVLLRGNPSSIIIDFYEKNKYDIIIMGSRGLGNFKELVLCSVSSKVVHHSQIPVLLMK